MQLLARYARGDAEEAFAEIVSRHADLVHSAALRQVRSPDLAKEVAQTVFIDLARKARQLPPDTVLVGWLYEVTRRRAIDVVRREVRRRGREQIALELQSMNATTEEWTRIEPLLDEAMGALDETDRLAVLLRYFQNKPLSDVGQALGVTDDAAQKRVSRAVEQLRRFFSRRGITVGAGGLVTALSVNSVVAAPLGVIKTIPVLAAAQGITSGGALAGAAKGLLKAGFAPLTGLFAASLGSAFFTLKAEVESARSPRERRFLVRMIWVRFMAAFIGAVVPISIGLMVPDLIKRPGVVEFGFAAYCLCGALEISARMIYFHRRRRQIQLEDGTWSEFESEKSTSTKELLADLKGRTSKANSYAALAAVLGLASCLVGTTVMMVWTVTSGHGVWALFFLALGAHGCWWSLRRWRGTPRLVFDPRLTTLVKFVLFFCAGTLLVIDLSWARGRLPLPAPWAIGVNLLVILAYALLIGILARYHHPWVFASEAGNSKPA